MKQINKLDEIFKRELDRLDKLSQIEALSIDDLRRLETLTRSLKNYIKDENEDREDLDYLSKDQLIALATMELSDTPNASPRKKKTKPRSKTKK